MKPNDTRHTKKSVGEYDIFLNCYLGGGSYGKVYKGLDRSTKQQVAVKMIQRSNNNKLPAQQAHKITSLKRQATILSKMNSEGVVGFRDIIATKRYYYIIQQLCDCTLEDELQKMGDKYFTQKQAIQLMIQFLNGYYALISLNVIHRDLKPGNLLMKNKKLKIADFGLSRKIQGDNLMLSLAGTQGYQSPQIFRNQNYSPKCDVYSFGCIFYQVLFRKKVFNVPADKIVARMNQLQNMEFPITPKVSQQTKDLIKLCLRLNQADRASWLQVFNHPVFYGRVPSLQKLDMTLKYILSTIRKQVQSRNLDVTRFLQKMGIHRGKQIGIEDYAKLLLHLVSIDKSITKQEIKYSFGHFDTDNSGKISFQQFQNTLMKHGVQMNKSKQQTQFDLIKKVVNEQFIKQKTGQQDFTQQQLQKFENSKSTHKKLLQLIIKSNNTVQNIETTFNLQDLSQKGLDQEQFAQLIQKHLNIDFTKQQCAILFQKFDENSDKRISFQQFRHNVCRQLKLEDQKSYIFQSK